METLVEVVHQIKRLGSAEAVRWSNGLRTGVWTYRDLYERIAGFANLLSRRGIRKGDRLIVWSENRPEWIALFWAAVLKGVEVVPADYRFSVDLVQRIIEESRSGLLIHGSSVDPLTRSVECLSFDDVRFTDTDYKAAVDVAPVSRDDVVEIVYTSGTTGTPKGVVHRHRNICSNLQPFWTEIDKYKKWAVHFQPIRILNLLPLSHMFGQSLGLFIPVALGGSVVFTDEIRPGPTIRLVRQNRISVIVSVPKILETLQNDLERRMEISDPPEAKGWFGVALRWWRYRRIHSAFGWKFWALVVGGARVDPAIEEFWANLGYAVIQGYGLTEASPVVAVNHPFDTRRGSLGKVVPGQEVRIAPDGEILVRGESVTGERGEWLATGDLGTMDSEGRLYYRGRKKDLIVTPEGLNVHPEDVEKALNSIEGVRDSAVIAVHGPSGEEVHAVLILSDPSVDPARSIGRANEKLETHQRIHGWTIWPDSDFPRTASTLKVRRYEVANRISGGIGQVSAAQQKQSVLDSLLERAPETRLAEDMGLSSLERVELLSEMEARYGLELDEEQFSGLRTAGEIRHFVNKLAKNTSVASTPAHGTASHWPQSFGVRALRFIAQKGLVLPLLRHYLPLTVGGIENLQELSPPVIFVANHTSHLDTVAMVAALPPGWRRLLAPAMSKDHFRAWFERRSWTTGVQYFLARSIFNTYPLPQRMSGVKAALEYTGDLVKGGYCPLVFPEGERTADGTMHSFKPGIGLMAVKLQTLIVPVRISGLYEVYSVHDSWPHRGPVRVVFGPPLRFTAKTSVEKATTAIEKAVRDLN